MNIKEYVPRYDYTDDPIEPPDPWDGTGLIEYHRLAVNRYMRIEQARRNPMLLLQGTGGEQLYRLTSSGYLKRTSKISKATRLEVKERDKVCVWCGSSKDLEIDHIIRYADGGSNKADNLRLLCHDCHGTRGGRA